MTPLRAGTVFRNTVELFRLISKTQHPPSALASEYFQRKKHLTSEERRSISSFAFAALRNALLLSWLAKECGIRESKSVEIALLHIVAEELDLKFDERLRETSRLIFFEASQEERLNALDIERQAKEKLEALQGDVAVSIESAEPHAMKLISTLTSMPRWILEASGIPDLTDALMFGKAFQRDAPVCLRAELSLVNRVELQTMLRDEGIATRNGSLSPAALVLDDRANLSVSQCYRRGLFEIQDEASQLVAYAVSPRRDWRILDACAGAGGKTLHLCDLMHDSGEIIATDTESKRLSSLQRRARKVGFTSIQTIPQHVLQSDAARPDRFDAVLVDAPCSGIGTARRNPRMKYRLTPKLLERLTRKQSELIDQFSNFVKPGGVLVYSTCSFLPQENDVIIERFLEGHREFVSEDLADVFNTQGITLPFLKGFSHITLLPSIHQTDGFFIARMRRL